MNILLANDDGINAPGILALAKELSLLGNLYISAPNTERSAASSAITINMPIRAHKIDYPVQNAIAYSVSGTPADCVKIGLTTLFNTKFDLVVSGINKGANMCVDMFYSGTVAAALEGAFKNILSVAVSLDSFDSKADYQAAAKWAIICIKKLLEHKVKTDKVYNINIPAIEYEAIKGIKITKGGLVDYFEKYEKYLDPSKQPYYWLSGNPTIINNDESTDIVSVKNGYVSITPLRTCLTDAATIEQLNAYF